MMLSSIQLVVLVALAQQLLVQAAVSKPNTKKPVRIRLEKKIRPQKGHLGQTVTSYYVTMGVGTPPKDYKLLVDVNSRECWLPHHSRVGLLLSRLNYMDGYSKRESSTSIKEESQAVYNIAYKTSEFSGKAYRDVWEFRNVTDSSAPAKFGQRFLAISSASNDHFAKFGVDGVMAINPWPLSETGSEMVSVGLARANLMGELKVGLWLDQEHASPIGGELAYGGVNPAKFLGDLKFHEITNHHSWEVDFKGILLGQEPIGGSNEPCTALFTTTSNDLYGPPEQVKKILKFFGHLNAEKNFDNQHLYEIDCLQIVNAPSLTMIIDDSYYMIPPTSYIRKKTEGLLFKTESCYLGILSSGSTSRWEFGTNFLSNFYTVFDLNLQRIAFGTPAPQTQTDTPSTS